MKGRTTWVDVLCFCLLAVAVAVAAFILLMGGPFSDRSNEPSVASDSGNSEKPRDDVVSVDGKRKSPATDANATNQENAPDSSLTLVVEIDEVNTDTFAASLGIVEAGDSAGVDVTDDAVFWEEDEAAQGGSETASEECRLLVIHRTHFQGKGRYGVIEKRYAFAELPASIPLPATPSGDRWTCRMAEDPPLPIAARQLRLFSADRLVISQDDESIVATIGESKISVAPGKSVDLPESSRSFLVREQPVTLDDIELEDAPVGAAPIIDETPLDHGRVQFRTKLKITNIGSRSLHRHAPVTEEEL